MSLNMIVHLFSVITIKHCVNSVRIQSFSSPHFPVFGLNSERYSVSLCIQTECEKIPTWKTLNTGSFHAVKPYTRHDTKQE